ncbi:MAG: carboxymuconolactone decarboxylase family protein [Planctomycetota bacterium]
MRALCAFAEELTRTPARITPASLDALRAQGLDDGAILEAVHVIGYFNHINRIADALGVDLEKSMRRSE